MLANLYTALLLLNNEVETHVLPVHQACKCRSPVSLQKRLTNLNHMTTEIRS